MAGMQSVLEQEARIAGFKSEVSKSQELHLASLTRDTERLTSNLDKIRSEIRSAMFCPLAVPLRHLKFACHASEKSEGYLTAISTP